MTTHNSQFALRQETLGTIGQTTTIVGRDPDTTGGTTTTTTTTVGDGTTPDPGAGTTTTTGTTPDPGAGTTPDPGAGTTTTTGTTPDPGTTTATTATEDKPKKECSGYCKTANALSLGLYGAFILFLLAMAYQAVKVGGKVNTPT